MDIRKYNRKIIPHMKQTLVAPIRMPAQKQFVFLCGGNQADCGRYRLREYFNRHYPDGQDFLIAEEILFYLHESEIDLLTMENFIGAYADCIVVILESPGAIAELGAFANIEELCKKILVVNDDVYKKEKSFINQGPVAKIVQNSKFKRPVYFKTYEAISEAANDIASEIFNGLPKYGKIVTLRQLVKDNVSKELLILIHGLLRLLTPITQNDAIKVIATILDIPKMTVRDIINIILSLKYFELAQYNEEQFLVVKKELKLGVKLSKNVELRTLVLMEYHKNNSQMMEWYAKHVCRKQLGMSS